MCLKMDVLHEFDAYWRNQTIQIQMYGNCLNDLTLFADNNVWVASMMTPVRCFFLWGGDLFLVKV